MGNDAVPHQLKHFRRTMSFDLGVVAPEHEADALEGLCEGFVRANQIMIRAEPDSYPCCLGCGEYRYAEPENCRIFDWKRGKAKKVDPNCQHVFGAYHLDKRKRGTCIDLACMLAAIYREKDNDARARVIVEHQFTSDGERLDGKYHAMVMKGDGEIVDPTLKVKAALPVGESCGC